MTVLKTTRRLALAVLATAIIAACAPPPEQKQPDPTVAQVNIAAGADANPDPSGRASPAVVFIYALQPGAQFNTAPYDVLTGGELGELGKTMNRIARLVIVPGKDTKKIFELPKGTAEVGVAVAFRDIDTAVWRSSKAVAPNEVTLMKADIAGNKVVLN